MGRSVELDENYYIVLFLCILIHFWINWNGYMYVLHFDIEHNHPEDQQEGERGV